jgi:hypothetical protein
MNPNPAVRNAGGVFIVCAAPRLYDGAMFLGICA